MTVRLPGTRATVVAFGLLTAVAPVAGAQSSAARRNSWEVLTSSGALLPTGAERSAIKNAPISTVQLSYVVQSRFAVTSMVGWGRTRDIGTVDAPKLDVFTYDVGAEARAPHWIERESVSFSPFIGIGAGARSYNYRSLDVDATHNMAAYSATGGELGIGRVHLRLEVRDYVSGFKPLDGRGASAIRNDFVALIGLRLVHGE